MPMCVYIHNVYVYMYVYVMYIYICVWVYIYIYMEEKGATEDEMVGWPH